MKLVVFCTVSTGIDSIAYALNKGLQIDLIVGVSPLSKIDTIAGYIDISKFCQSKGIAFLLVDSYSLSSSQAKNDLLNINIDLSFSSS